MDDHQTFAEPDAAETRPRKSRKGALALAASALVLCTAGGALGGLAIGEALHSGSSSSNNPAASGGGYAPMFGGGYGPSFRFPGGSFGTMPSGNQETTAPATSRQLVGLVRIQTTLGYQNGAAAGTGMILTSDGFVVTNHHVIAGSTKIVVTVMSTGKQYQATLVGSDASDDIAVLKLSGASGLSTIESTPTPATVGQTVTAVGDAQGASSFTASPGKVTAVDQTIAPSDRGQSETLTGVIQFAADVMSGDSGGATYDSSSKVIGMTTAASTGTQTNGYAIPIAKVLSVSSDLENRVPNSKYAYGLPSFIGIAINDRAVVEQVYAGTGAASAGLTAGDRITAVDGVSVADAAQLQAATRKHAAGQTITLTWTTATGQRHTAQVRLTTGPAA
ncbi:MAG: S1C family serine protease [Marmoricola sp.]